MSSGAQIETFTDTVVARAAAKVNLHLGVGPVREDGFHPLCTVYQAVGLYDDVAATPDVEWRVEVSPIGPIDCSEVPRDETNLAVRAARLLLDHHGRDDALSLRIDKGIPVAGGLAGGSADAAAALVAVDRVLDLRTTDDDLLAIAASLGSDVPFALIGGTALGLGRGEQVQPVADGGSWWWVLVPSDRGLATPLVYREFDDGYPGGTEHPEALLAALAGGDPDALGAVLRNDLQEPALALRPDLAATAAAVRSGSAAGDLLSGSGPTWLGLAHDADHARAIAADLQALGLDPVLCAPAPVAGTHVVEHS